MINKISLFIIIVLTTFSAVGQVNWKDSILTKTQELQILLNIADTIRPEESVDINSEIFEKLKSILTIPTIIEYNLDSLLSHDFLQIAKSEDKRLWIFSWYENTGGTFKSHINLIHYKTVNNTPKCVPFEGYADTLGVEYRKFFYWQDESAYYDIDYNNFDGMGARYNNIHKLMTQNNQNLYLSMGSGVGCMTCCYYTAMVVELTEDSINFNYQAFLQDTSDREKQIKLVFPDHEIDVVYGSNFMIGSRCGNIQTFEFDEQNLSLYYIYFADDETPIKFAEEEKKLVKGILRFDGSRFIKNEEILNIEK